VLEEVRAWQARPLDKLYLIRYLDALVVKVKQDGPIANRSIYLAVGVNLQGRKEVLGFWAAGQEGAKFWLSVVTELKNRGAAVGRALSEDRAELAGQLDTDYSVLPVPGRNPAGQLHDQRH